MSEHDVFISYSSSDIEFADNLRDLMISRGISCWMAPYSIPFGGDYSTSIPDGINDCIVFVLVLSEHSMQSVWVPKELDSAISSQKPVIPFRIDKAILNHSFSFCLVNVQRIEAYTNYDEGCEKLIEVIKKKIDSHSLDSHRKHFDTNLQKEPILRSDYPLINNQRTIGRDDVLEQMDDYLKNNGVAVLWGIGGIGKSKVAKKYLSDKLESRAYTNCIWLEYRGKMMDTILNLPFDYLDEQVFIAQSKTMARQETSDAVTELSRYKLNLLKAYGSDTLLVIDGINALSKEDVDYLSGLKCHLIFVTRIKSEIFPSIEVTALNHENCRQLFFDFYEDGDMQDEKQLKYADIIIQAIGRHTLTVTMLARYAQMTGIPLDELYCELKNGGELYKETISDEWGKNDTLEEQMNRLFDICSLDSVQKTILSRLSILPTTGIKKYDFKKISPEDYMNEVEKLIRMGWIRNDSGIISVHPLVSHCVHKKLENLSTYCYPMIDRFLDSLNLTGIKCLLHQEDKKNILKSMVKFISCKNQTGIRLYAAAGSFINSLTYQHMIIIDGNEDSISFFSQHVNVGEDSMAEYNQALMLLKKAEQAFNENFSGEELPELKSDILNDLGATYFNMNDFNMSRKYHLAAYELRKQILPEGDMKRLISARRRAIAAYYNEEINAAEKEFKENLKELIGLYSDSENPEEIVELAKGYSYVGKIELKLGRTEAAKSFLDKALELLCISGIEQNGRIELEKLISINY